MSGAKKWIDELNKENVCAYIRAKNLLKNYFQLVQIIKRHKVDRVITHFCDIKTDVIIKFAVNKKKVINFFHGTYKPRRKLVVF